MQHKLNDLLVVASPTSQPLCTDVAVPTDGQPEWMRPKDRKLDAGWRHLRSDMCGLSRCRSDGPFPLWAARWAEVECPLCYGGKVRTFMCSQDNEEFLGRCQDCPASGKVGAIVELVEVVGPSHHADECGSVEQGGMSPVSVVRYCHPDAAPDGWHTPTGQVTVLDQPIPCERPLIPPEQMPGPHCGSLDTDGAGPCLLSPPLGDGSAHVHHGAEDLGSTPASVWTADDALDAKLTEAAR